MRKSVILAAEGVLFPRSLDRLLESVAAASGREGLEVRSRWQKEAEDDYLCGRLPESFLWEWLGELSSTDPDLWRQTLWISLCPLASAGFLSRLARWADIHVVAESRAEWLRPVIRGEGLLPFLASIHFSSESGLRHPDILALPEPAGREVFLVDNPSEATTASRLGYRFVPADRRMFWLQALIGELSGRGPQQHLLPTA